MRPKLNWQRARETGAEQHLGAVLAQSGALSGGDHGWLLERAGRWTGSDPAFVQCLRLYLKEELYLLGLVRSLGGDGVTGLQEARHKTRQRPPLRRHLGVRFELSRRVIAGLIRSQCCKSLLPQVTCPVIADAISQIEADSESHLAFLCERLTLEYADFNFIRRNLRRARLRLMCRWSLRPMFRSLYREGGLSLEEATRAVRTASQRFEHLLERMVPYRRDALIAALLDQAHNPYRTPQLGEAPSPPQP